MYKYFAKCYANKYSWNEHEVWCLWTLQTAAALVLLVAVITNSPMESEIMLGNELPNFTLINKTNFLKEVMGIPRWYTRLPSILVYLTVFCKNTGLLMSILKERKPKI